MDKAFWKTEMWKGFHLYDKHTENCVFTSPISVVISANFMSMETRFSNLLEIFNKEFVWILDSFVKNWKIWCTLVSLPDNWCQEILIY